MKACLRGSLFFPSLYRRNADNAPGQPCQNLCTTSMASTAVELRQCRCPCSNNREDLRAKRPIRYNTHTSQRRIRSLERVAWRTTYESTPVLGTTESAAGLAENSVMLLPKAGRTAMAASARNTSDQSLFCSSFNLQR